MGVYRMDIRDKPCEASGEAIVQERLHDLNRIVQEETLGQNDFLLRCYNSRRWCLVYLV